MQIEAYKYIHPFSDAKSGIYPENHIRVEVYADLYSENQFFGVTSTAGILIWRDWVNNNGGLCLSVKGGKTGCSENDLGLYSR